MTKQYKYSFKIFTDSKEAIDKIFYELTDYLMKGEATFSTNRACGILINTELSEPCTQREAEKAMRQYQKYQKEKKEVKK
jgi:hypothetical protein